MSRIDMLGPMADDCIRYQEGLSLVNRALKAPAPQIEAPETKPKTKIPGMGL